MKKLHIDLFLDIFAVILKEDWVIIDRIWEEKK